MRRSISVLAEYIALQERIIFHFMDNDKELLYLRFWIKTVSMRKKRYNNQPICCPLDNQSTDKSVYQSINTLIH